ncbi:hypothetical protein PP1_029635 [Pseudonocardia sp. P1]
MCLEMTDLGGAGVFGDVGGGHALGVVVSEGVELPGEDDGSGGRDPAVEGDRLEAQAWCWSAGRAPLSRRARS